MTRLIFALIASLVLVILILAFTDGPMPGFHPDLSRPVTYSPMPDLPKPVMP